MFNVTPAPTTVVTSTPTHTPTISTTECHGDESDLRDWILSAIDKLRERKARPDVDRISALVHRYHAVSKSVTSKHLEELVDYGAVIRVEYKGSVSYRNALKWKRSCLSGSVLNSHATSTRFIECLKRLEIKKGQALAEVGFTVEDIEAELAEMRKEAGINGSSESSLESEFRGTGLIQALDRESATGGLVRLPGPRYALDEDGSKKKVLNMKRNAKFMDGLGMPPRRGRPPGSKTKKKLLPAPIINKKIKIEPVVPSILARQICRICASADSPENMLRCKDCSLTAHMACLNYPPSLLDKLSECLWQCARCKTCAVCLNNSSFGKVFVCKVCDRGYHMQCHRPHMMTNHPNWTCAACSEVLRREEEEAAAVKREEEMVAPESQNPPEPDTSEPSQTNAFSDDVRTWSVIDVHDWLVREGFSREAQAFKEQEIDGACLLLMKRMDVLTGLGIKLGPAVKIHSRILRFQESSI